MFCKGLWNRCSYENIPDHSLSILCFGILEESSQDPKDLVDQFGLLTSFLETRKFNEEAEE